MKTFQLWALFGGLTAVTTAQQMICRDQGDCQFHGMKPGSCEALGSTIRWSYKWSRGLKDSIGIPPVGEGKCNLILQRKSSSEVGALDCNQRNSDFS
jgi:hypothetical protein